MQIQQIGSGASLKDQTLSQIMIIENLNKHLLWPLDINRKNMRESAFIVREVIMQINEEN
ncbi:MAG: hypothetical protein GY928_22350 [Colwellia sp.]|nr:hypothetical protein [Colwellia sp.]